MAQRCWSEEEEDAEVDVESESESERKSALRLVRKSGVARSAMVLPDSLCVAVEGAENPEGTSERWIRREL